MGDVETVRAGLLVSSNLREWEHEHLWVAMCVYVHTQEGERAST